VRVTRPTGLAARRVTPDLARGLLLALIAVANAHLYLVARPIGFRGYPSGLTGADRGLAVVQMLLVDGRVYPLFAALVGYGVARLAERAPEPVVRRRGLVLLGVGAAHGLLLFPGDIIGAYGLVILLVGSAVSTGGRGAVSSRGLLITAGLLAVVGFVLGSGQGLPQGVPTEPSIGAPTLGAALAAHPGEWLRTTIVSALLTAPAVLVGVVIARTGILDGPATHRRRLTLWAVAGLVMSVVLGLPLALAVAGWWVPPPAVAGLVGAGHTAGGYAGALGLLGVMGLLGSVRWPGRDLVAAAGTWSMTLYLSQSVVFTVLLASFAGAWGERIGLTTATVIGLLTWLAGLLIAGPLARAGHRGPAELLVRRLTYPRRLT
jgi:uncharacterized protein